jgi:hypothetical protein
MVEGSRWVGLLVAALFSQGCSFAFVDGPPDRHEKMIYFDCTSTLGPAVVDITYAATSAAIAAGSAQEDNSGDAAAVYAVTAGIFGASAIYGIVKTQTCNQAKDELRRRLMTIVERDARVRAREMQRVRTPEPRDVLTHPRRLPKRKKKPPVPPPPEQAQPPAPLPSERELPPPTPAPAAPAPAAPAPSPATLPSKAFPPPPPVAPHPVPATPTSPPEAAPVPAPVAPKSSAPAAPAPTAPEVR